MDYDSFLGEVQSRARLSGREDAARVTRVTLETLSERVDPGAASDVAAQLPDEIGRHLSKIDAVESFEWEEFVDRIVDRGGYDPDDERADAVYHARVVMAVVNEAVSAGALDDVRAGLSPSGDWDELFSLGEMTESSIEDEP